ncbi:hypothetical protein GCM10023330_28170 [Litoribaculum gwangyangense]|uniref:Beta-lactamase-related domain-containing protein n=2 Tax=Litoribaculum gwangyangense TaxID=1130722 RepID=A0ABP9CVF2_9FLAO
MVAFSVIKVAAPQAQEMMVSNVEIKTKLVDPNVTKAYKLNQQKLQEALTAYFQKAIASGDIVGAGVSIVKEDSILIAEGFGKRSFTLNKTVNSETVFRLGSLSKGFAGVLAAKLKNEGFFNWTDKVNSYVSDFKLGDSTNTNNITLAHILSQTSGAPYHSYTNLVEAGLSLSEIAKRFKTLKPVGKPGEIYSYQNAMFALSGEIMEMATNKDIRTLLNDNFFKPLGMTGVSMDYNSLESSDNIALPHSKSRYGWRPLKLNHNYYNAIAAGGINASALDMAKWMQLLLGHRSEIIDYSVLNEAFSPSVKVKEHNKYYQRWPGHLSSYYGFGWRIHKFKEKSTLKTMVHHGGSVNSYRNEIAVYPDDDLGICVLLNSNSKISQTVIPDLYKIVNDIFVNDIEDAANPKKQITSVRDEVL